MSFVAARPDVSGTVEQIMSGEAFVGLLCDETARRAAMLEAVLGRVMDEETRVAWVGNPLRSPLTTERLLIQVVGPDVDLRIERGPLELARTFARPMGGESRLLIVVQQPETLGAEAREALGGMTGHLAGQAVQVQFLFVGTTAFTTPPPGPVAGTAPNPPVESTAPEPEAAQPSQRRSEVAPLLLLLLALAAGVLVPMMPPVPADLARALASLQPVPTSPIPTSPIPPSPTSVSPTSVSPAIPAADGQAQLRRRFEAFLDGRAASLPPMTEGEKDALFMQFLTHHHRE